MRRLWTTLLTLALCAGLPACTDGLDPDSLVRDLRVLATRVGDDAPGSSADVDLMGQALKMRVLAVEPTGPGRKLAAPRSLRADWYLCLPDAATAAAGGAVPAGCVDFRPEADPSGARARIFITSGLAPELDLQALRATVLPRLGDLLGGAGGGSGGGAGGIGQRTIELRLPLVVRVEASPPSPQMRDGETALTALRVVIPKLGETVPPNHNPVLQPLQVADNEGFQSPTTLTPCAPPAPCQRGQVRRGAPLYLRALTDPASIERYLPLDESGRGEQPERPRFLWFASDGKFSELRTGQEQPNTKWTDEDPYRVPAETKVLQLWVAVQDGRLGSDFHSYELDVVE